MVCFNTVQSRECVFLLCCIRHSIKFHFRSKQPLGKLTEIPVPLLFVQSSPWVNFVEKGTLFSFDFVKNRTMLFLKTSQLERDALQHKTSPCQTSHHDNETNKTRFQKVHNEDLPNVPIHREGCQQLQTCHQLCNQTQWPSH